MLKINDTTTIPEDEMVFTASRSSGPGGQNVNKVSTRITVLFDIRNSIYLSDEQKRLIFERLSARINKAGILRVVSQRHRTQKANREAALELIEKLLRDAVKKKPVRRKTKVPERTKLQRLEEKKRRGLLKQERTKDEV